MVIDFVKIYEKAIKVSSLALAENSQAPPVVLQEMMKLSSSLLVYSPLESVLFPGGLLLESIYKHKVPTIIPKDALLLTTFATEHLYSSPRLFHF